MRSFEIELDSKTAIYSIYPEDQSLRFYLPISPSDEFVQTKMDKNRTNNEKIMKWKKTIGAIRFENLFLIFKYNLLRLNDAFYKKRGLNVLRFR